MFKLNSEKGQAIIMIAFGIVALVGFTALAVDGGRVLSDRRHAQNAADTAALQAALSKIREENYVAKGLERAVSNGYDNDADSTVTVILCSSAPVSDPCTGLPTGANLGEYIRVKITSDIPMTFARVLGRQFVTNKVEAIARVQGSTSSGDFLVGAGMVSVRGDNANDCYKVLGNADLTFHDSGIFVNCTGSSALNFGGSADIYMDADAQVAASPNCTNDPSFNIDGPGEIACGAPHQTVDASTFAHIPTTLPTPTCSNPGSQVGTTMNPGYFNSNVSISNGTVFNPGTYCFNSSLNLGNSHVTFSGNGSVKWVLSSSVSLFGTANFGDSGDSLEIYTNGSDFTIQHGTLTADRFRFFGNGNSDFDVQGGTLTSGDAYIFSESGKIEIDAQADANLHAPPPGDTFDGILMHMPWSNTNSFELNGGTNNVWTGTILIPHSNVTYNGGSGFELHGQVIGYTFKINGGAEGDIYYESSPLLTPPDNPSIEFTK
ncbi:MAG TPA: hypothetical protein DCX53_14210 [Anaerolineae bacterium]|nr:hypothetical protein [Anaerolineae bacterium]